MDNGIDMADKGDLGLMRLTIIILWITVAFLSYTVSEIKSTVQYQAEVIHKQTQIIEANHNVMLYLTNPKVMLDRQFQELSRDW